MDSIYREKPLTLTDFSIIKPPYRTEQKEALDWLAAVHAESQSTLEKLAEPQSGSSDRTGPRSTQVFEERLRKVLERCACGPSKIAGRNHVLPEMGSTHWQNAELYNPKLHPHGDGTETRTRLFANIVDSYFENEYANVLMAPSDVIHVTCTGYVSPSGAQQMVSQKGWGATTRVTHAYHMGCYAALPAARMAAGFLCLPDALRDGTARGEQRAEHRVDIVHTELCTLHLDPSAHSIEQLVVQSLFADGFVRYSMRNDAHAQGLRLLSLRECIVPNSTDCMSWRSTDHGMQMTLSRDVPERIGASLRSHIIELFQKAGLDLGQELRRTVFTVHPGGPKIIDGVKDTLELSDAQVQISRDVLFEHGNMSSATLPHVWQRIVLDEKIAPGTPVVSLAFGPGLTVCCGLFRKQ